MRELIDHGAWARAADAIGELRFNTFDTFTKGFALVAAMAIYNNLGHRTGFADPRWGHNGHRAHQGRTPTTVYASR